MRSSVILFVAVAVVACRWRAAAQGRETRLIPPVLLNHLYVVVDSETIADIVASPLITQELGSFQTRTTTANGGETWTGHYLRGQNTYIELFGPGGFGGTRPGMAGIGFGVEESGGVAVLSAAFSARGIAFDTSTRVRLVDGHEIPWFFVGALPGSDSATPMFSTWVMEYHSAWAVRQAATDSASPSDITRRRFLQPFYDRNRLLSDVVGATVAVPPSELSKIADELEVFGYLVTGRRASVLAHGPRFDLIIVAATPSRRGLLDLRLALNRTKHGQREYRLGPRSVLRFDTGPQATWSFF
jgi:hypothetical protein